MKKNYNLIYILLSIVIILVILTLIFFFAYKALKEEIKDNSNEKRMYATVIESGKNFIKVKDENTNEIYYIKYDDNHLNDGEIIEITYKDNVDDFSNIDVIVSKDEDILIVDRTTTTRTTVTSTSEIKTTIPTTTSTNYTSDDEMINMFKTSYMSIENDDSKNITESIKDKFIDIIDFIFYDKEINGRTFNSLTDTAKSKIIYYALLIDAKIDSKWPDYKKNISEKYEDIKAKLLAIYLDMVTSICSKGDNARYCEYLKSDLNVLKYSLNLTWDTLKRAFKYGYNKTTDVLVKWYEVFSGKV